MKLLYASGHRAVIHRRRIQDLLKENAGVKTLNSELAAKVSKQLGLWGTEQETLALFDPAPPSSTAPSSTPTSSTPTSSTPTSSTPTSSTPTSSTSTRPTTPSFMRSTAASRAKAAVPAAASPTSTEQGEQEEAYPWSLDASDEGYHSEEDEEQEKEEKKWDEEQEEKEEKKWEEGEEKHEEGAHEEAAATPISLADDEWALTMRRRLGWDVHSLAQRTGTDLTWLRGPAGGVRLPSHFVKATQRAALDLAAEAFYGWGMRHRPDKMRRWAPEGPWDLALDRQSLGDRYGIGMYPSGQITGAFFFSAPPDHMVPTNVADRLTRLAIDGFGRDLRNRSCHFNAKESSAAWMLHAQVHPVLEFAELAADEGCADGARALLAAVRREAEAAYDEVEGLALLRALPGAEAAGVRPWAHHHEVLFQDVLTRFYKPWYHEYGEDRSYRYGGAVLHAAFMYEESGGSLEAGLLD